MSVIDYSTFSIEQLLANRTAIDKMIRSLTAAAAAAAAAAAKEKATPTEATEKVKRQGGAWSAWTKKCMAEHPAEVKAFQDAAESKVGAHLKWMSINKGKTSPEWLAFKADWESKGGIKTPDVEASEAEASDGESEVFQPKVFMVDGQKYMRLWNSYSNDWAAILLR
jgi:hypothetical protein